RDREYRLVELVLVVPMTCQGVLEKGYGAGGGWRDGNAVSVSCKLLEAFQLHRAREEREAELLFPQVIGLTLVDRHARRLRIGAEQVIDVRVDNAGRCRLRRRVELRESLEDSQRLQR